MCISRELQLQIHRHFSSPGHPKFHMGLGQIGTFQGYIVSVEPFLSPLAVMKKLSHDSWVDLMHSNAVL